MKRDRESVSGTFTRTVYTSYSADLLLIKRGYLDRYILCTLHTKFVRP